MGELLKKLRLDMRRYQEIMRVNRDAVDERNATVLKISLICGVTLIAAMLCVSLFVPLYAYMRTAYIAALLLFAVMLACQKRMKRLAKLAMVYLTYGVMIAYACITSAFVSPHFICVTILAFLFQYPILYVDKGWRVALVSVLSAMAYLGVIYRFKDPALLLDEVVNVCCATVLALVIGTFTRRALLENFEMKRKLNIIAYTDQLTGLYNRRRLFERLAESERPDCAAPITGMIMLDLDDFKRFNDTWGHLEGDECLRALGKCLKEQEARRDITFFRYGGEEFVGVSSRYASEELAAIADDVRQNVAAIRLPRADGVTVSIGVAVLGAQVERKYTALLSAADMALYAAKNAGRNRTAVFTPDLSELGAQAGYSPSFRQR